MKAVYYTINWKVKNQVGLGFTCGVEVFKTMKDRDQYLKGTSMKNDTYYFHLDEINAEKLNDLIWYPTNQDKSIDKDYNLPVQFH